MIPRIYGVSIAWIALLAVAPACFAQDISLPPSAAPDSASVGVPQPAASRPTPMRLVKRGSFGGLLGWGSVMAGEDYSNSREGSGWGARDARSRPAFSATFRYQVAPWLRWQISSK